MGAPLRFLEATLGGETSDCCIIWPFSATKGGYAQITMRRETQKIARLICKKLYGDPIGDANHSAHSCGNRLCINPKHLRWATRKENEADKITHGTSNRGDRCGTSKLTPDAVLYIRTQADRARQDLADEFGVTTQTITDIRARRSWAWL